VTGAEPATLEPNHHGDHPGFSGITGFLAGLTMVLGRRRVGRLACDLAAVTAHDHVVDVGCGPGAAAREAARRGAEVTGVDPASVMLAMARRLTVGDLSVTWTEGAAEHLPLPDGVATVVWSLATVHHWPRLDEGLAEARRVLKPGGRLLAIERQARPGAKGLASHGWIPDQADGFADRCRDAGFSEATVARHKPGRVPQLSVLAIRP
jgi:ubiquinone/menaquinone biosynthesis C-methylase UbiE